MKFRLLALCAFLWWLCGAFQIFPLGWVALAPLFLLVHDLPKNERLKWGYFAGFASFALINWWLIPTITRGGAAIGASPALSFVLSLVAVLVIASVHGVQVLATAAIARGNSPWLPLQMALIFTFGDWLRCQGVLAHTWGNLGVSQVSDWPILWLGQHGLTFLCAFVAFTLGLAIKTKDSGAFLPALTVLVLAHGAGLIGEPTSKNGPKLRVLAVQTGVSSLRKSGNASGETPFVQAYRLTLDKVRQKRYDLILWPETTLELSKNGEKYGGLNWEILQKMPRGGAKILFGANVLDENGKRWNEAILFDGETTKTYAKRRLVPFGERAPFTEILPFLGNFAPQPMVEIGQKSPNLRFQGGSPPVNLHAQICFESCFPLPDEILGAFFRYGSELRVVLTNDEWFIGTEAPRQHRAMAQLRAAEARAPLVQSANGAYSFFVDSRGQIVKTTEDGAPQTLEFTVDSP